MLVLCAYLVYLLVSIAVTVWVARTLHQNGRTFLVDAFHGQEGLADSVNHLLVVGFYLINLGWIVMTLQTHQQLVTVREAVELLSSKIGTVLFVLGAFVLDGLAGLALFASLFAFYLGVMHRLSGEDVSTVEGAGFIGMGG